MLSDRMRCLGVAPNYGLPEAQDEIIAVSNHDFALLVNSVFGTIEDLRAARAQLLSQRVNPCHSEVGVIGALSAVRANLGLIGAIEEHLDLVSPHDCENRRSIWHEADALSIPITCYSETENVAVILGRSHQVRHSELRNRRLEANVRRCVFAHAAALQSATSHKL